ncbi:hypothetical protein [Mycolicibacterium iranicum]|uniref:Uncharacterized protein n=1 Tax=Mycolicibacterium iranicum TaxID=912594 RepID=A0A178LS12_MYCIR|nr:hypothetical protein [Mycolicibacterium iranicum]OAN36779.1 hypothetical protein A4X20_06175 [Mycolicibacterium iranicum]
MPDRVIRIDSLRLRVRGVAAAEAKDAVHSLGPELLRSLASQQLASTGEVSSLNLGAVQAQGANAVALRAALAHAIASGVNAPHGDAKGHRT